jgi:periplasmic copper chaperone A
MKAVRIAATAAAVTLGATGIAMAHVTLETQEAPSAKAYKGVLRVGHGCEGGSPTVSIRVQIPEGVIAVKPAPKAGWKLETVVADYPKPVKYYDETLTKGVKEISWSGNKLPDEHYDEFVFRAMMPDAPAGTMLYFPVVQTCEKGVHRWIEIPAAGKKADDYKEPAAGLKLMGK